MRTNLPDTEIIAGYLNNNKEAHKIVLGWIHDVIRARLWSDTISPDDIVSLTTEKLYNNFRSNKFSGKSTLKTYVQKITKYTIIDGVRLDEKFVHDITEQYLEDDSSSDPLEDLIKQEEIDILRKIMKIIDEKCLELWKLIFWDEMKQKDIAQKQGITIETVKIRVFRCKGEAITLREKIFGV